MPTSAERLFDQLDTPETLAALVGQSEDADFDCKEWPSRTDAARGSIAKAACAFTNANGGVIVIGLTATGRGADTPDVVQGLAPVEDCGAVASAALDIILKFVEPGIEGVQAKIIRATPGSRNGFVTLFIPASEGAVRRSKVDWRFYVRIASGSVPMEYFQIEERFGRRPVPKLKLHIDVQRIVEKPFSSQISPLRQIVFGLENLGRGLAKFPGIRFTRLTDLSPTDAGLDGHKGTGLPLRASEAGLIVFRGGVDDVIYPGEVRWISKLNQIAVKDREEGIATPGQPIFAFHEADRIWVCEERLLEYEISCEGIATVSGDHRLERDELRVRFRVDHPSMPQSRGRGSSWS